MLRGAGGRCRWLVGRGRDDFLRRDWTKRKADEARLERTKTAARSNEERQAGMSHFSPVYLNKLLPS